MSHKSQSRHIELLYLPIIHNERSVGYPGILNNKYSLTHFQISKNKLLLTGFVNATLILYQ